MFEQMNWSQYLADDSVPPIVHKRPSGNDYYMCPRCDHFLALYDYGELRFTYKNNICKKCGYIWKEDERNE